jgi:hypothetical protein
MAKFTPGTIVTAVSGKLAGSVFCNNPNGNQIRPRAKVKRQSTTGITQPKQWMSAFSSQWRTLTDSERAAWIAETANYTYPDRLGNTITMTGLQLFCAVGMANRLGGTIFSTSPPTPATYPALVAPTLTCEDGFFRYSGNWLTTPIDSNIVVYASAPKSPGVSQIAKSDLVWMDGFTNTDPFELDFTDQWQQRFGSTSDWIGQRVFAELWIVPFTTSDILRFLTSSSDVIFT